MAPISNVSGLASGVQWNDLIEQMLALETQRRLDPITNRVSLEERRLEAWSTWQSLATKFRDAAAALRDGTALAQFAVTGGTSPATGRTLLSATAGPDAAPGNFDVEVLDLARANKVSGAIFASATTALGLSGEFVVNGRAVTVSATDTLASLRDKINAAAAGAEAGVNASVLTTGPQQARLVLTATSTGAAGIELIDDANGILQSLGFVEGTTSLNVAPGGGVRSYRVSSTTKAIAAAFGVTMPPPSTINVGGNVITVDLNVDSLSSIAARILAAGGTANLVAESVGGTTTHRLVTGDTVSASDANGQRVLEILGFLAPRRGGVAQVLESQHTFTGAGGAAASTATLLTALEVGGTALGIAAGDTLVLQGTRGDGSVVDLSFTIGAGDTLQTLLDRLNDAVSGFGAGSRPATASLVGGQIVLSDVVAGDSQLSLTMSVSQQAGTGVSLGQMAVTTVGRLREVVAGADARVRIDGVMIQRATNVITDALAGVTLDLHQAEAGTTTTLAIARDTSAVVAKFGELAAAYNELVKFRDEQSKADAPLYNNSSLRSDLATLTNTILATVTGVTGPYTTAGMAGLSLQKDGRLTVDADKLSSALAANPAAVKSLFSTSGTATDVDVSYFLSTAKTVPGTYAIDITAAATTASATGAGFGGTYVDDGVDDTMTVTDSVSGANGSITLANGDTTDDIVNKLNAMFASSGMHLAATKSGTDLVITSDQYGSAATFTVAYQAGGTDGTAQLGLAAGTYAGTDVAGTIGGLAATGKGQILTGAAGGATEGLSVRVTGTTTGAKGTLTFAHGVAGALYHATDLIGRVDGLAADKQEASRERINSLRSRADTVQQLLDRRRAALEQQFVQMESALARIQQQSASLASFINSLRVPSPE